MSYTLRPCIAHQLTPQSILIVVVKIFGLMLHVLRCIDLYSYICYPLNLI